MKKIWNTITLVLIVAAMAFTSCKKSGVLNDAAVFIPKSSEQVTAFNMQNMLQKADFEAIKQMEFYKKAIEEAEKDNPAMAAILKNPSESGIDLTKNVYLVMENSIPRFYFSLANPSAFEKMVKETPVSKNGVKIVRGAAGFVAWKDNLAIVTTNKTSGARGDDGDVIDPSLDVERLFSVKPDQSVVQNPKFVEIMSAKHDLVSYSNFAALKDLMGGMPLVSKKDLESSLITSYADFENGQMVSKSQFDISKNITEQFGILFKNNVNTDFSKFLTNPDLAFACTFALDTKGVKQIMAENPGLEMLLGGGGSRGFSADDVLNTLDGDMMLAVSNSNGEMAPALGIKLKDKNTAVKFLNMGVEGGVLKNDGNGAYSFADKNLGKRAGAKVNTDGKLAITDDVLLFSPKAVNGGAPTEASKSLTSNIFAMYMNFQKFQTAENAAQMKDMPLSDFKMSINGKSADAVLKTTNANENVLKSFFRFVNQQYLENNLKVNVQ